MLQNFGSRTAANLLIGSSPWISCHFLQKYMICPQLFVLVEVFCLLRQLACHNKPLANTMLEIASGYDGHPPRQSWGPGTTLAVYCKRVGRVIHPNGELGVPDFTRCNILQDSCQKKIMAHWERNVIQDIEHRKGIPDDVIFNWHIVFKVLEQFTDSVLRGIYLSIEWGISIWSS